MRSIPASEYEKWGKFMGESEEEKYWYMVGTAAEGESHGYVYLTKEEAQIVKYATDEENWKNASFEEYSGCFFIDVDNPKEQLPEKESD